MRNVTDSYVNFVTSTLNTFPYIHKHSSPFTLFDSIQLISGGLTTTNVYNITRISWNSQITYCLELTVKCINKLHIFYSYK